MSERLTDLQKDLDQWRSKALDVESHPVVKLLLQERDDAKAKLAEIHDLSTGWQHGNEGTHLLRIHTIAECGTASSRTDTVRLDWLEKFVNEHGALLLHDGNQNMTGHYGLGLSPGTLVRTLREAIDSAMGGAQCQND